MSNSPSSLVFHSYCLLLVTHVHARIFFSCEPTSLHLLFGILLWSYYSFSKLSMCILLFLSALSSRLCVPSFCCQACQPELPQLTSPQVLQIVTLPVAIMQLFCPMMFFSAIDILVALFIWYLTVSVYIWCSDSSLCPDKNSNPCSIIVLFSCSLHCRSVLAIILFFVFMWQ